MKETIKEQVEQDVIKDIICDVCKKSCQRGSLAAEPIFTYGELRFHASYGSEHDGMGFRLEICDDCCVSMYRQSGRTDAVDDDFWDVNRNG